MSTEIKRSITINILPEERGENSPYYWLETVYRWEIVRHDTGATYKSDSTCESPLKSLLSAAAHLLSIGQHYTFWADDSEIIRRNSQLKDEHSIRWYTEHHA